MGKQHMQEVVAAMAEAQESLSKLSAKVFGYDDDLDNEIDNLYMRLARMKITYMRMIERA